MDHTVRRVMAAFIWLLALSLPLVLIPLVQGVRAEIQLREARDWQRVPAQVVTAQAHSRCHKVCVHRIELDYRYQWQGSEHHGHRLWFGEPLASTAAEAQTLVAALTPGSDIRVHVDPQRPVQSVLRREVGPRTWEAAAAPLLVWLLSVGVWLLLRWVLPFVDTRRPLG